MTCTTFIYGQGGNCINGSGLGNFGEHAFSGYWTPATVTVCGWNWTSLRDSNGNLHPDWTYWAFHSPTVRFRYEGCPLPYDCVNGKCELNTKYNTPGQFPSLEACEAVCGFGACASGKICADAASYCPPGKKCIDDSEYKKIQELVNRIC